MIDSCNFSPCSVLSYKSTYCVPNSSLIVSCVSLVTGSSILSSSCCFYTSEITAFAILSLADPVGEFNSVFYAMLFTIESLYYFAKLAPLSMIVYMRASFFLVIAYSIANETSSSDRLSSD